MIGVQIARVDKSEVSQNTTHLIVPYPHNSLFVDDEVLVFAVSARVKGPGCCAQEASIQRASIGVKVDLAFSGVHSGYFVLNPIPSC